MSALNELVEARRGLESALRSLRVPPSVLNGGVYTVRAWKADVERARKLVTLKHPPIAELRSLRERLQ